MYLSTVVIVTYFVGCVMLSLLINNLILYATVVKRVVLIAVNALYKSPLSLLKHQRLVMIEHLQVHNRASGWPLFLYVFAGLCQTVCSDYKAKSDLKIQHQVQQLLVSADRAVSERLDSLCDTYWTSA